MTTDEIKAKYPSAIEMIDSLDSPEEVFYIRANKTVHKSSDSSYYLNHAGLFIDEFKNLEHVVKWFFGTTSEQIQTDKEIKQFSYNKHLSVIKDSEVWLDKEGNVAKDYCDFTNKDFDPADLEIAKKEL